MKLLISILFIGIIFLSACNSSDGKIQLINEKASLPASFKFSDLGLKVMTSFIDKKNGTTSILYANDIALNKAMRGDSLQLAGEIMALITWKQQDDDRWFGAQVPGNLQSLELVKTINNGTTSVSTSYKKYIGENLIAAPYDKCSEERIKFIRNQRPSFMP